MLHISAWSVEGEGGVGLICVRITETVAAKKKLPPWSLMAKKVNIIPVTS